MDAFAHFDISDPSAREHAQTHIRRHSRQDQRDLLRICLPIIKLRPVVMPHPLQDVDPSGGCIKRCASLQAQGRNTHHAHETMCAALSRQFLLASLRSRIDECQ